MARVGDVVELAGRKVGDVPRTGTVVAIRGAMVRIRWASGEETSLIPGPGTLSVTGAAQPAKKQPAPQKATTKKAAPKKAAARKTSARKTTTKKAPAKKSSAKKGTAGKKAGAKKGGKASKKRR